jgi:hypothetical protein
MIRMIHMTALTDSLSFEKPDQRNPEEMPALW